MLRMRAAKTYLASVKDPSPQLEVGAYLGVMHPELSADRIVEIALATQTEQH